MNRTRRRKAKARRRERRYLEAIKLVLKARLYAEVAKMPRRLYVCTRPIDPFLPCLCGCAETVRLPGAIHSVSIKLEITQ